eukprot:jgi/Tetstr1/426785/TSEL_017000.t1
MTHYAASVDLHTHLVASRNDAPMRSHARVGTLRASGDTPDTKKTVNMSKAVLEAAERVARELRALQDEYILLNYKQGVPESSVEMNKSWGQLVVFDSLLEQLHTEVETDIGADSGVHDKRAAMHDRAGSSWQQALMANKMSKAADRTRRSVTSARRHNAAKMIQVVWRHYRVRAVFNAEINRKWKRLRKVNNIKMYNEAMEKVSDARRLAARDALAKSRRRGELDILDGISSASEDEEDVRSPAYDAADVANMFDFEQPRAFDDVSDEEEEVRQGRRFESMQSRRGPVEWEAPAAPKLKKGKAAKKAVVPRRLEELAMPIARDAGRVVKAKARIAGKMATALKPGMAAGDEEGDVVKLRELAKRTELMQKAVTNFQKLDGVLDEWVLSHRDALDTLVATGDINQLDTMDAQLMADMEAKYRAGEFLVAVAAMWKSLKKSLISAQKAMHVIPDPDDEVSVDTRPEDTPGEMNDHQQDEDGDEKRPAKMVAFAQSKSLAKSRKEHLADQVQALDEGRETKLWHYISQEITPSMVALGRVDPFSLVRRSVTQVNRAKESLKARLTAQRSLPVTDESGQAVQAPLRRTLSGEPVTLPPPRHDALRPSESPAASSPAHSSSSLSPSDASAVTAPRRQDDALGQPPDGRGCSGASAQPAAAAPLGEGGGGKAYSSALAANAAEAGQRFPSRPNVPPPAELALPADNGNGDGGHAVAASALSPASQAQLASPSSLASPASAPLEWGRRLSMAEQEAAPPSAHTPSPLSHLAQPHSTDSHPPHPASVADQPVVRLDGIAATDAGVARNHGAPALSPAGAPGQSCPEANALTRGSMHAAAAAGAGASERDPSGPSADGATGDGKECDKRDGAPAPVTEPNTEHATGPGGQGGVVAAPQAGAHPGTTQPPSAGAAPTHGAPPAEPVSGSAPDASTAPDAAGRRPVSASARTLGGSPGAPAFGLPSRRSAATPTAPAPAIPASDAPKTHPGPGKEPCRADPAHDVQKEPSSAAIAAPGSGGAPPNAAATQLHDSRHLQAAAAGSDAATATTTATASASMSAFATASCTATHTTATASAATGAAIYTVAASQHAGRSVTAASAESITTHATADAASSSSSSITSSSITSEYSATSAATHPAAPAATAPMATAQPGTQADPQLAMMAAVTATPGLAPAAAAAPPTLASAAANSDGLSPRHEEATEDGATQGVEPDHWANTAPGGRDKLRRATPPAHGAGTHLPPMETPPAAAATLAAVAAAAPMSALPAPQVDGGGAPPRRPRPSSGVVHLQPLTLPEGEPAAPTTATVGSVGTAAASAGGSPPAKPAPLAPIEAPLSPGAAASPGPSPQGAAARHSRLSPLTSPSTRPPRTPTGAGLPSPRALPPQPRPDLTGAALTSAALDGGRERRVCASHEGEAAPEDGRPDAPTLAAASPTGSSVRRSHLDIRLRGSRTDDGAADVDAPAPPPAGRLRARSERGGFAATKTQQAARVAPFHVDDSAAAARGSPELALDPGRAPPRQHPGGGAFGVGVGSGGGTGLLQLSPDGGDAAAAAPHAALAGGSARRLPRAGLGGSQSLRQLPAAGASGPQAQMRSMRNMSLLDGPEPGRAGSALHVNRMGTGGRGFPEAGGAVPGAGPGGSLRPSVHRSLQDLSAVEPPELSKWSPISSSTLNLKKKKKPALAHSHSVGDARSASSDGAEASPLSASQPRGMPPRRPVRSGASQGHMRLSHDSALSSFSGPPGAAAGARHGVGLMAGGSSLLVEASHHGLGVLRSASPAPLDGSVQAEQKQPAKPRNATKPAGGRGGAGGSKAHASGSGSPSLHVASNTQYGLANIRHL